MHESSTRPTEAHLTGAPTSAFQQGFVDCDGLQLHYQRHGDGPAVVMLHAGPCSAKVMGPTQLRWGHRFTSFAFDLPGFGLSGMLDSDDIRIEDLADAIAMAIRRLGLTEVALYGRHTGAAVAVEVAHRHPELCTMVLCDGFPVFRSRYTPERLAEYLPPVTPVWDGTHLVWCWFRYREQHVFWPWDRPALAQRADCDLPPLDFLYRGAIELLEATHTYHRVYRAAFLHAGLDMIDEVTVPVCYGNRPGDSQFKTVGDYPATARVEIMPREGEAAAQRELEILLERPPTAAVPAYASRLRGSAADSLIDYIPTQCGPTFARIEGWQSGGRPLLFLHDLPGSLTLHADEIETLGRERPVLAIDLAGNGNSPCDAPVSIGLWRAQLIECLDFLGLDGVDVYAHGTAASVAADLAAHHPERIGAVTLRSPAVLAPEGRAAFASGYAPDIAPEWEGGNFLRLWHHLRDQELWYPWHTRTRAAARTAPPNIEPAALHERAVMLLKQPQHYQAIWREVLDQPLWEALQAGTCNTTILTAPEDVFAGVTQAFCRETGLSCSQLDSATEAGA